MEVSIKSAGVVDIGWDAIAVNSENIIERLRREMDNVPVKRDYNGCFAGRLTITVETLGDLEDADE